MSRYIKKKDNLKLNYGWDHALGYWYDIVDSSTGKDKIIEEKSSVFGMSRSIFIEKLTEWEVSDSHLMAVAGDIPF